MQSQHKNAIVAGTLDTKGPEVAYMRSVIEGMGVGVLVMDIGIFEPRGIIPEISRHQVCEAAGSTLESVQRLNRRDMAMEIMGKGAAAIARTLYDQGRIDGIAAVGGNQGTSIATAAMKALPLGMPKIMVSTVASGNTRPYIGYSDTAMMFPIADIVGGVNSVTRTVLANAAGAIAGMCLATKPIAPSRDRAIIALTGFGNVEPAVTHASKRLRELGYEPIAFHASGAGGSAMEQLVSKGVISGVIDIVTHEVLGELFPDDFYAPVRPGRLVPMIEAGIPLIFIPGGLDYYVFGGVDTIPERCRSRQIHYHNPLNTNVRASAEELREVGKVVAERLSLGAENVRVMIPRLGWTEFGREGGPLYDPEANEAFVASLRRHASPTLDIRELDLHINAPEFMNKCVSEIHRMMTGLSREPN